MNTVAKFEKSVTEHVVLIKQKNDACSGFINANGGTLIAKSQLECL